jgi:phospholipid-binding lipoprotein MlaA
MNAKAVAILMGSALAAGGCATPGITSPDDPYENFNRQMYGFNDSLDRAVLEPVAKGYRAVTNEPIREGVSNFVNNLNEPVTFANEVLQLKIPNAAGTASRFVINTTIGLAGVFDTASVFGLKRTDEDFGQTLAVWGVDGGPYLVLPFLGSTNPRDLFGRGVDSWGIDPFNYVEFEGDDTLRITKTVLGGLGARERAIETIDNVRTTQLDPYTTLRRFHVRNRAAQIGTSEPEPITIEELPDYELDF